MKATIKNNVPTIEVPLNSPTLSKSGKTYIVASSGGNVTTSATVEHAGKQCPIVIGLNAYIKP
jgi:hypothetical protein